MKRIGLVLLMVGAFLASAGVFALALKQPWFIYVLGVVAALCVIVLAVGLSYKIWPAAKTINQQEPMQMTFDEAMVLVAKGKRVRRACWTATPDVALQRHSAVIFSAGGSHRVVRYLCAKDSRLPPSHGYIVPFAVEDECLQATDWEVVEG